MKKQYKSAIFDENSFSKMYHMQTTKLLNLCRRSIDYSIDLYLAYCIENEVLSRLGTETIGIMYIDYEKVI